MKEVIYVDGLDKYTAFLLAEGDDCSILLVPASKESDCDCIVFADFENGEYCAQDLGSFANLSRKETINLIKSLNELLVSDFQSTEYKLYLKLKEKYESFVRQ